MKKCRMCGTCFSNDDYEFCPYCGSRVVLVPSKQSKVNTELSGENRT